VPTAPNWSNPDHLQPPAAAARLDWLLDPGSLTRRLTRLASGDFAVRVLRAGLQALRADECAALDVAAGNPGWVREVYLLGQGEPWVFARSVATREALYRAGFEIDQIGEQSLGEVLFHDQRFTRGPLELTWYPPIWLPPEARAAPLLARRSRFDQSTLGVLVAEVALPALWARLGLALSQPQSLIKSDRKHPQTDAGRP